MNLNKINELLENKDFFEKISKMKNAEEVKKAFKENGVELSIEDIKELEKMNHEAIEEMNKEELENVSGGGGKSYHFWEGMMDVERPHAQKFSIKPETKTHKIFRTMGKAFAWTVGLPATLITRSIDSANHYSKNYYTYKNKKG